jgi:hypothetical protein
MAHLQHVLKSRWTTLKFGLSISEAKQHRKRMDGLSGSNDAMVCLCRNTLQSSLASGWM